MQEPKEGSVLAILEISMRIQKLSAEQLLALGGCIIFFSFGVYLYYSAQRLLIPTEPIYEGDAFTLGQLYFNHDDDPAGPYDLITAQYYYEKAIAEDPKMDPQLWYQSGRVDFINGDFDSALAKFEQQIVHFGDRIPNVYYMIGLTYGYKARETGNAEEWQKGAEAFETFITYAPSSPWPRVDLAWIYFSQGRYEDMIPVLEEGLQHRPENPWLLNMYGLALLNTGEKEKAHTTFSFAYEQALKLSELDWGRSYPGNDPKTWGLGLQEFRDLINKNVILSE